MIKDRKSIITIAIISFVILPFAINKGLFSLHENWDSIKDTRSGLASMMPFNWFDNLADITFESVNLGFHRLLIGLRGFGYATMVYCIIKDEYGLGFIIALVSNINLMINLHKYGYELILEKDILIAFAIPFAMWFFCIVVSLIFKGKWADFLTALVASLTYWVCYSFINGEMFFNVSISIFILTIILTSVSMKQMDL